MTTRETRHRIQPFMRELAAENRHFPSQPERILWSLLRKSQLGGLKFRRQAVIGPYIVDFLCPSEMLIVEVDGESHVGRAMEDESRTRFLMDQGYRVIHFTNDDVLRNLEAVGLTVLRATGLPDGTSSEISTPHPPPNPLPFREGGSPAENPTCHP